VRVLLDATAVPADRRGVGRYVDSVVPALQRAGVDIRVVCRREDAAHYGALSGSEPMTAGRMADRRPSRLVWEQAGLPRVVRRVGPDVLHCPHYTQPVFTGIPRVVTVHDATFFTDPGVHTRTKGPFFRAATRYALHRADCCIVPSHATAKELVRVAGADPAKLQVAYHGVDGEVFAPPSEEAVREVRAALNLPEGQEYVAFLGTLEPRKNVPALVRGWVDAFSGAAAAPALILAGGAGWDTDLDAAIATVPAQLTLIRPGYLPMEHLAPLLGGAQVVAYPSLGEGFGLPVLEAMACGAAVLTTRRLALPEIGDDAVAYTEPDPTSVAKALTQLVGDPAERARLAQAAVHRARTFSWDGCAQAHLRAYQRALRR
jgi:glycosyltransferase involved in cell wall biosynthesis